MKRRLLLQIIIWISFLNAGQTQSYNTSVGMRLGTDWGISAQHRVDKRITIEGILQSSLQRDEVMITVLGERHYPFISPRLNFYMGGGLHKGWLTAPETNDLAVKNPFGFDFVGGIEFTMARINLSYDFKPAINVIGGEKTIYSQTGISIRYVISKKPFLEGNKKKKKKGKSSNWKFWEKN